MKSRMKKDDDFIYRITPQSRSKSVPRHVKFADRPYFPESTYEDNDIILKRSHTKDGEILKPLLKESQYAPPPPSRSRVFRNKFIRKFKKNTRKIYSISLFIAVSLLIFDIIFRKGNSKTKKLFIKSSSDSSHHYYPQFPRGSYYYPGQFESSDYSKNESELSLSDICLYYILFATILYLLF